jgi:4-amino-4-deoxy-L-arabinose transferase-like glycosyltransferase
MSTTATSKNQQTDAVSSLTAIIDYAVSSHARAAAVLILTALLAFLPGFFQIAPTDRDEARFAQASKQMLETGEYVDIHFQNEVRYKKPVGIYWLQVGVVKAAGALGVRDAQTTIWLYRIPSLLGAIGAVLLTYWSALAFVSRRAAVLAGLMMATSIMLGIEARLAKTDAMLLLTTTAAMGALARAYLADRKPAPAGAAGWVVPAIFWTALGAGMLIKGPLIVMFAVLAVVALAVVDRSGKWLWALKPIPGLIWFCVLVLPWFLAIMTRAGNAFIAESVGQDLLSKIFSSQEAHGAPPGFYLLLFWLTFWPGATLALMAVPGIWNARHEKGAKFLLAWIVPAWILLELVITKLPHYVLPLYPAIAILIAGVVDTRVLARQPWLVRGTGTWFFMPLLLGTGIVIVSIAFGRQLGLLAWPFFVASMIFGLWAWRLYAADGPEHSLLRGMLAALLLAFGIYAIIIPSLSTAFPSAAVAQMLRDANCKNPQLAAAGFHEPSLVFLAGTETKLVDGSDAAEFLRAGGCRFALIEKGNERSFLRRAEQIGLRYLAPQRFEGYNYSSGRAASIAVYQAAEGAQ